MNIIAFGASTSKKSINKLFATFVANQFEGNTTDVLDLNDFPLPLFSVDLEAEGGHPPIIHQFIQKLESADLIIISMAEHNGGFTAAFKNLFDWTSRVKANMFENKKLFLLATSPGGRGGMSSLEAALSRFPRHGAQIIGQFSLPKFNENFNADKGILNEELKASFLKELNAVRSAL
ncbi:MAG: NAD(P)H-dependent oxidoreductase [Bacteroidia bacterium]|nr:NAD(P)H-dependent oxidoreductase [Bacteroidia bacterium]